MAALSNTDSWCFTHCSYFYKKSKYGLFRPVSHEQFSAITHKRNSMEPTQTAQFRRIIWIPAGIKPTSSEKHVSFQISCWDYYLTHSAKITEKSTKASKQPIQYIHGHYSKGGVSKNFLLLLFPLPPTLNRQPEIK